MVTNKALGNAFEEMFCELLSEHGFWVHRVQQNQAGQPADVIATKNNIPYLIDCKECKNNRFSLSRIESNQKYAMDLWDSCGNNEEWFALNTDEGIYMVHYQVMMAYAKSSMNLEQIKAAGVPLGEWVEQ